MNMRKSITVVLLVFCMVFPSFAQLRLTPEAGVNIVKGDWGGYGDHISTSAGVGLRIGMGLRYSFNREDTGWAVQSGLYYTQRKKSNTSSPLCTHSGDKDEIIGFQTSNWRKDYLEMPILLQYAYKFNPDMRLHLAVGPYIAYGIAGKEKLFTLSEEGEIGYPSYNISVSDCNPFKTGNFKRFDTGANLQLGLEIKNVAILLNYSTNLYKPNLTPTEHHFSISIGYTL